MTSFAIALLVVQFASLLAGLYVGYACASLSDDDLVRTPLAFWSEVKLWAFPRFLFPAWALGQMVGFTVGGGFSNIRKEIAAAELGALAIVAESRRPHGMHVSYHEEEHFIGWSVSDRGHLLAAGQVVREPDASEPGTVSARELAVMRAEATAKALAQVRRRARSSRAQSGEILAESALDAPGERP